MQKHLQSLKLTLLNMGSVSLDNSWNYDNVISPFSRMYYISKGTARVYHNDTTFELKAGYMYLIPSYTYSRYQCDDHMNQYYISFSEELGKGLSIYNNYHFKYELKAELLDIENFKRLLELNPNRALLDGDPKTYDNRPSIIDFIQKNEMMSPTSYLETHGILISLLSRFMVKRKEVTYNSNSSLSQKIIESTYYIKERLSDNLTVEGLAERYFLNQDYFSRMFHKQVGIRPIRYIQSKRIEHAQLLLATTNHSLQEIADKVGLSNVSYFSRLFKSSTGKAPGQFRKEHWQM